MAQQSRVIISIGWAGSSDTTETPFIPEDGERFATDYGNYLCHTTLSGRVGDTYKCRLASGIEYWLSVNFALVRCVVVRELTRDGG